MEDNQIRIGFAMCGSFCTFSEVIPQMKALKEAGYDVTPILSEFSYKTDTRFGKAEDFIREIEEICGKSIIHSIEKAEPIGPKKLLDILVVAPCTGNTLGKMANGITDSCVLMAAKAHLRNQRPLVIAISTNDALGASAKNIGSLLNQKYLYFVPYQQDNPKGKAASMVANFVQIKQTVELALKGEQIQPLIIMK